MDKKLKDMAKKIEGDFINLLCTKNDGFDDITEWLRNNDRETIEKVSNIRFGHKSVLSLSDYRRMEYDQPTDVDAYFEKMSILTEYTVGGDTIRVGDEFDLKDIKFAEYNGNVLRVVTDKKGFTLIR